MSGAGTQPSLTWWGHSTVRLDLDEARVLTDPLLRPGIGPLRHHGTPVPPATADVDLVLVSHLHHDHCDLPSLRRLPPTARLVVPQGAAGLLRTVVPGPVEELAAGESVQVGGLTVAATPALHPASRRRGTGRVRPIGFLLRGRHTVYVAGDTDLFPGMVDLAGADVALLPVGGWGPVLGPGHLDPLGAATALRLLRPALAVPVHWGSLRIAGLWRVRPRTYRAGTDFRTCSRRLAPEVRVLVPAVGERVQLGRPLTRGA